MEYSLEILRRERNKLDDELQVVLNKEPKDFDVIVTNERLLEDLNKAIDLLWMVN